MTELSQSLQNIEYGDIVIKDLLDSIETFKSPDDLDHFFKGFQDIFKSHGHIQEGSSFGIFIREMYFAFENLLFDGLSKLFNDIQSYRERKNIGEVVSSVDVNNFLDREIETIDNMIGRHPRSYIDSYIDRIKLMIPETPKIYYLQFLNAMGHGDFALAVDLLYRYFDYYVNSKTREILLRDEYLITDEEEEQKSIDQEIMRILPYAPLLLSSIHIKFGHIDEAVRLIQESVRLIQRNKDDRALPYALSLMTKISELQYNFHQQIHFLKSHLSKASQHNMNDSLSLVSLEMANYNLIHPLRNQDLEESLLNSEISVDIYNVWNFIDSGMNAILKGGNQSILRKASISSILSRYDSWKALGNRTLANLMAEMLPASNDEAQDSLACPILCNMALQLSSDGKFDEAFEILILAQEKYPQPPSKFDWMLCARKVLHEWATMNNRFDVAEVQIHKLSLISSNLTLSQFFDSLFRHTEHLIRKNANESASNLISFIMDGCNSTGLHYQTVRYLLTWADIHMKSGSYITAIPYILRCINMSKRYKQELYSKMAKIKLAEVYLRIGNSDHLLERATCLLNDVTPFILENGTSILQAQLKLVSLKVCIQKLESLPEYEKSVYEQLGDCESYILKSNDHILMMEFYYIKARVMNHFGKDKERNDAARVFRKLQVQSKTSKVEDSQSHFYVTPESLNALVKN